MRRVHPSFDASPESLSFLLRMVGGRAEPPSAAAAGLMQAVAGVLNGPMSLLRQLSGGGTIARVDTRLDDSRRPVARPGRRRREGRGG